MKLIRRPPTLEPILLEGRASFAQRRSRGRSWPFNWHYHPECELTLILRGHGLRFVGDSIESFGEGDLVLIGPDVPHTWASSPEVKQVEAIVIQFKADFWGGRFTELGEFAPIAKILESAGRGVVIEGSARGAVVTILKSMTDQPPGSLRQLIGLLNALAAIAAMKRPRVLSSSHFQIQPRDDEAGKTLKRILDAIRSGIGGTISQARLARDVDLSPSAFSRFFKRQVGKTYVQYLNEWRIGLACRALLETDEAITNVAMDCGFENLSNFNRRFRQIKRMTPREYRSMRSS